MTKQPLTDKIFGLPVRLLRGDWLMDGYITDDSGAFRVVVLDGTAYSMDLVEYYGSAEGCALDIDADGTIGTPGSRSRFSASPAELRRVGIAV